jgi:hypothetical protein
MLQRIAGAAGGWRGPGMRIAPWIVIVGCLLAFGARAEDWVEVIHSSSGTVWQVDRDSIGPAHPGVRAWFRFTADHNLLPSSDADYRSGRTQRLFDCRGGRSADLSYDWYFQPNWLGAVGLMEHSDPANPHWLPPRPGSIEDALMAFVCDYASKPADETPTPAQP